MCTYRNNKSTLTIVVVVIVKVLRIHVTKRCCIWHPIGLGSYFLYEMYVFVFQCRVQRGCYLGQIKMQIKLFSLCILLYRCCLSLLYVASSGNLSLFWGVGGLLGKLQQPCMMLQVSLFRPLFLCKCRCIVDPFLSFWCQTKGCYVLLCNDFALLWGV